MRRKRKNPSKEEIIKGAGKAAEVGTAKVIKTAGKVAEAGAAGAKRVANWLEGLAKKANPTDKKKSVIPVRRNPGQKSKVRWAKAFLSQKRQRGRPDKHTTNQIELARKILRLTKTSSKPKKSNLSISKATAKKLLSKKWGRGRPSKARLAKLAEARKLLGNE